MTTRPMIRFVTAPPSGVAIEWDGQEFEIVSAEPWTNRQGEQTAVLTWRTPCRACGEPFEFTSGRTLQHPIRNCPAHRMRTFAEKQRQEEAQRAEVRP